MEAVKNIYMLYMFLHTYIIYSYISLFSMVDTLWFKNNILCFLEPFVDIRNKNHLKHSILLTGWVSPDQDMEKSLLLFVLT